MATASVSNFFNLAGQAPFTQLKINWRERSLEMGEALVQCGIELQIRQRLQAGAIRLIDNRVHSGVQVDMAADECEETLAFEGVRTLKLSPLPNNASCDEVRAALLAANIRVTAVRSLGPRSCEVSVDASPQVDHIMQHGIAFRRNWYLRACDVMSKRSAKRFNPSPFSCFVCGSKKHIGILCIRQKPKQRSMVGA